MIDGETHSLSGPGYSLCLKHKSWNWLGKEPFWFVLEIARSCPNCVTWGSYDTRQDAFAEIGMPKPSYRACAEHEGELNSMPFDQALVIARECPTCVVWED